jgi:iron complex outermembrane receptor protein
MACVLCVVEAGAQDTIRGVRITARRSLKEIGMQQTRLDTAALHENIALSMADVLTFNTPVFIKQYGRATLSTVAFRGTSPSHTQVSWNGMRISSPMLGMTDFSTIPAHLVDDATLLHGPSSVTETGGGLGGAVRLATSPTLERGFGMQYTQGVGSFHTFDQFLRLTHGGPRWQFSTRAVFSLSRNDFRYRNYNKKMNILDDSHNIVDTYYPVERNSGGGFRDLHILQEAYHSTPHGDRLALQAWWFDSRRGLPMLSVDHRPANEYTNQLGEQTLRAIASWQRLRDTYRVTARAGYIDTRQRYDFLRNRGNGVMAEMIRARSRVNTIYGSADGEYYIGRRWLFSVSATAHQHFVRSEDRTVAALNPGETAQGSDSKTVVGYDQARVEVSLHASAKWMPTERAGLSVALREEMFGKRWAPLIPAFFADYLASRRGNVVVKASVSRNFRFPSLNDLYFLPGGNPDLKNERGLTYDAGVSFATSREGHWALRGEATWFDSRIDDWIVWLPDFRGVWTPVNIRRVHAYGVELKGGGEVTLGAKWRLGLDASLSWTPSINQGSGMGPSDSSVGRQLVYVPEYSAAATGKLARGAWRLLYKWCYYSERYTMSSNEAGAISRVLPYFMSDVSVERLFSWRWSDVSVKLAIRNLLNEEYESVLSRPMPRMNFEIFVGFKPKFNRRD